VSVSTTSSSAPRKLHPVTSALLLIAATFIAYGPIWRAGFIWNDDTFLVMNPLLQAGDGLYRFWCTTSAPDYFPLTSTTLWVEWRLWGAHALGYHLVNVLLHASSAVLLWRVLLRLNIPGAWLAAAIFALHPVNVESVAWITERKNTLPMLFYMLTLLWYLRFEDSNERRWYWLSLGSFVLALLSKTAPAPLPIVLLGLAWWRRGRIEVRDLSRSVPFFVAALTLGLVGVWFQSHKAIGTMVVRNDSFWSRLAAAGWALWFYLYKALVPLDLSFVYARWRINAANVLAYVPGILFVGMLVVCWVYSGGWRKRRENWASGTLFGLGYFVVMLLPVLGFLDIYFMRYSLVADHWQYFAIIGPIALVATGIAVLLERTGSTELDPRAFLGESFRDWRTGLRAVPWILLIALGVLTWRQSETYHDAETLWRATLARNPRAFIAHTYLGMALAEKNQVDEAIQHYRTALAEQPDFVEARGDLGNALMQKGEIKKALPELQRAVELQTNNALTLNNYGNALLRDGQVANALTQLRKAAALRPDLLAIHYNLGRVLLQAGQAREAAEQFQKAVEIQPGFVEGHYYLAVALSQEGRVNDAAKHLQTAVTLRPDFADAQNSFGNLLLQAGHWNEAVSHYDVAVALQPRNPFALNNLAWVLATCPDPKVRNGARAIELAQNADQLSGGKEPHVLQTLAAAYAEAGRFPEAIATAQRALKLAQGEAGLLKALEGHLALYRSGKPFRAEAPKTKQKNP
jgi:tetratricopeptide (TPR) repeat protein